MAGVSGPCPSCQGKIRAPARPIELPAESKARTTFKVEPRNSRPRLAEILARPMAEAETSDTSPPPPSKPPVSRAKPSNRLPSMLIACIALAVMVGVPMGLHSYMKKGLPKVPQDEVASVAKILPDTTEFFEPGPEISEKAQAEALDDFEQATAASTFTDSDPTDAAEKTLEAFLGASSLAERLPLIETQLDESELAESVLATSFPPSPRILRQIQVKNAEGQFMDLFYSVDFATSSAKPNSHTVLVRIRQGAEPKVVVDPFLDSFGGRLADYADSPSDRPATFQVIVTAVARCFDKSVPGHEEKLALKLLAHDNQKEIARAYFNKHSEIGEMLQDDASGFRYGQARPCKVLLQWNTRENSGMPFLEAVKLTDFGWVP